jgi:hypothetical protein
MSGTFITSIDDETTQDQRNNESSGSQIVSAVRANRRKLSPDAVLPQNSNSLGSEAVLKRLPTNVKRPQIKLALEKTPSLDLARMDLHEAIRGSIKNLNKAVPLGINTEFTMICWCAVQMRCISIRSLIFGISNRSSAAKGRAEDYGLPSPRMRNRH